MRLNCPNAATHQMGLQIKKPGKSEIWFGIVVCEEHRDDREIKRMLTPPGIASIKNTFMLAGKAVPDLDDIDPLWNPISNGRLMGGGRI